MTRVRSDFLCLDAIDNVLLHICRHEDEQAAEHPLSASLALPCHRYWLEQMKANTHNSPLSADVLACEKCYERMQYREAMIEGWDASVSSLGQED